LGSSANASLRIGWKMLENFHAAEPDPAAPKSLVPHTLGGKWKGQHDNRLALLGKLEPWTEAKSASNNLQTTPTDESNIL